MRHLRRALLLALAGLATLTGVRAQGPPAQAAHEPASAFLPVPPNVKSEGVPPIPASIVSDLAPYASSRRAVLLDWHPTRREIVITTAFGDSYQIHSVAGPGMDRQQLTFFPRGIPAPPNGEASFAADG